MLSMMLRKSLQTWLTRLLSGVISSLRALQTSMTRLWNFISMVRMFQRRSFLLLSVRAAVLWSAAQCCSVLHTRIRVFSHCSTMYVHSCLHQWILQISSVLTLIQRRKRIVNHLRMSQHLLSHLRLLQTHSWAAWYSSVFIQVRLLLVLMFTTHVQVSASVSAVCSR